jgi:large subunit ribosomal protein L29
MAFPKIEDARNLNDEELASEILEAKKKLLELRLLKATGRLEKPHEFKHTRHRIAQLMTVEKERELAASKNSDASGPEPANAVETSSETANVQLG